MLKQPVTQVFLTNTSIVKYKVKGKKFELACYPNKVMAWRNNLERDLDEVLQYRNVYTDVPKGE